MLSSVSIVMCILLVFWYTYIYIHIYIYITSCLHKYSANIRTSRMIMMKKFQLTCFDLLIPQYNDILFLLTCIGYYSVKKVINLPRYIYKYINIYIHLHIHIFQNKWLVPILKLKEYKLEVSIHFPYFRKHVWIITITCR